MSEEVARAIDDVLAENAALHVEIQGLKARNQEAEQRSADAIAALALTNWELQQEQATSAAFSASSAALHVERQGLLVVAYEAYKLSMEIGEFDTVVDDHDVDALDRALLKAFGVDQLSDFAEVGQRITTALGGYAAMLKAREP